MAECSTVWVRADVLVGPQVHGEEVGVRGTLGNESGGLAADPEFLNES